MYNNGQVTYGILSEAVKNKYGTDNVKWDIERTKRRDSKGYAIYIFWVKKGIDMVFEKELNGVSRKDDLGIDVCMGIAFEIFNK